MEMLMNKILLPVDSPNAPPGVVHQAAFLARHFHSKIILLQVVTPVSFLARLLEGGDELSVRDLHARIVQRVQKDLDQALRPERRPPGHSDVKGRFSGRILGSAPS
jgi:hypothetical protein